MSLKIKSFHSPDIKIYWYPYNVYVNSFLSSTPPVDFMLNANLNDVYRLPFNFKTKRSLKLEKNFSLAFIWHEFIKISSSFFWTLPSLKPLTDFHDSFLAIFTDVWVLGVHND